VVVVLAAAGVPGIVVLCYLLVSIATVLTLPSRIDPVRAGISDVKINAEHAPGLGQSLGQCPASDCKVEQPAVASKRAMISNCPDVRDSCDRKPSPSS
jgi:hypothetical protein